MSLFKEGDSLSANQFNRAFSHFASKLHDKFHARNGSLVLSENQPKTVRLKSESSGKYDWVDVTWDHDNDEWIEGAEPGVAVEIDSVTGLSNNVVRIYPGVDEHWFFKWNHKTDWIPIDPIDPIVTGPFYCCHNYSPFLYFDLPRTLTLTSKYGSVQLRAFQSAPYLSYGNTIIYLSDSTQCGMNCWVDFENAGSQPSQIEEPYWGFWYFYPLQNTSTLGTSYNRGPVCSVGFSHHVERNTPSGFECLEHFNPCKCLELISQNRAFDMPPIPSNSVVGPGSWFSFNFFPKSTLSDCEQQIFGFECEVPYYTPLSPATTCWEHATFEVGDIVVVEP